MTQTKTITKQYNEIDEDLKEKIREHFRNDEFLLPEDWYTNILDYIVDEKYKDQLTIYYNELEFDIYRNYFDISGELYLETPTIEKMLSLTKEQENYFEKDIVYDVSDKFSNGEMDRYFDIDDTYLETTIEEEIFSDTVPIDFEDYKGTIRIDVFRELFENAIKKYGHLSPEVTDILKKWLELMDASEIFFQDTIEIDENQYGFVVETILNNTMDEITDFIENIFYEKLDSFVSKVNEEIKSAITQTYENYYSDEYADESLADKRFEVIVDEDDNQIDIEDLNGEFYF